MTRLFISHSSDDNVYAHRVNQALIEAGYESTFLDFDPDQGLQPGQRWQSELFEQLRDCAAVVFIGSEASERSKWCHAEIAAARWLRKPIIPLRLPNTRAHGLLADLQFAPLDDDDERLLATLSKALSQLGIERAQDWEVGRSPYPGLLPLTEDYASVFFGREAELRELMGLLDPPGFAPRGTVVPVLGPSGCGKSSLVRAGLVPIVRARRDWVVLDPFTPLDSPLEELSLAMAHGAKRLGVTVEVEQCRQMLQEGAGAYLRLLRTEADLADDARLLVVVDQGEQLLTTSPPAERDSFLTALAAMCGEGTRTRVVVTVRTDHWDQLDVPPLDGVTSPTVLHVGPMTIADLRRVVEEPARKARIEFAPGLIERIVEDTGSGSALPLLAYTLSQLAASRRDPESRRLQITREAYDAVGGVAGGIAAQAAVAAAQLGISPAESARAVLPLVGAAGPNPVSRRIPAAHLDPSRRRILDRLAEARLITIDGDEAEPVYSVAHEALFVAWEPLRQLIDEKLSDLRIRDRLERQAADWRDAGKGTTGLLEGVARETAEDWASRNTDLLTPEIAEFHHASLRRARRRHRQRLATAALGAVLILTIIAVLVLSARAAREQSGRVFQALAEARLEADPPAAALLLLAADVVDPGADQFVELAGDLLSSPGRDTWVAHGPPGVITATSGAGLLITHGGTESLVWDIRTGRRLTDLPEAGASALRGDGRVAALTNPEGLQLWDLGSAGQPETLAVLPVGGARLAFSDDGSLLAVGTGDGSVMLFDVSNPASPSLALGWIAHPTAVSEVAFGAGLLATMGADGSIKVWDPTGTPTLEIASGLSATPPFLRAVPGEGIAAIGSTIGPAARVWAEDGSLDVELPGAGSLQALEVTWSGAFSDDFSRLVTTNLAGQGSVRVPPDDSVILRLNGHNGIVTRVLFVDSDTLITTGLDGTVRRWTLTPGDPPTDAASSRAELCEQFATTFDEELRTSVIGHQPYQPGCEAPEIPALPIGDLQLASPAPRPGSPSAGAAVYEESFDDAETDFFLGTGDATEGEISYTNLSGRYQVVFDGVSPAWTAWSTVSFTLSAEFSVSTNAQPLNPGGGCGISLGSGSSSTIVVTIDAAQGLGKVSRFVEGNATKSIAVFPVERGEGGTLEVSSDGELSYITYEGALVGTLRLPELTDVTDVGVAVSGEGDVGCTFDNFIVRQA